MTPTGTNLLGLVKHCAGVEAGYFGSIMDRPFPGEDDLDWHNDDDSELSGHMYATAAESREQVTDFYRRVWEHSDATITELPLDARGTVPWWPEERRHPTLHTLLVHTIQETARHPGHADIIRESIDGAAGLREGVSNMPDEADAHAWNSTTTSWTRSRGPRNRNSRGSDASAQVAGEAFVYLLGGQAEVGQRVLVPPSGIARPAAQPGALGLGVHRAHGVGGRAGQLDVEFLVHRLDGPERIGHELVVPDVTEMGLVISRSRRHEPIESSGPQLKLVLADDRTDKTL
jgi:hypothetical protein